MDINKILKVVGNKFSSVVEEGTIFDTEEYLDLGNYLLNAQISGSIYKGLPINKRLVLGGASSTGKTFLLLQIIKNFLEKDKENICLFFESEGALNKNILKKRNIDTKRILFFPVATIEDFRNQIMQFLIYAENEKENNKGKYLICLDSLGNLSTKKEIEDITLQKEKRDMTRAQLIKGTFRAIGLMTAKLKIPFIITNHVYESMGMFSQKILSGGSGIQYISDIIIFLSKARKRSENKISGGIFTSTIEKSRITKEKTKIKFEIDFEKGLNKYSGLLEFCVENNLLEKIGNRILINNQKLFPKQIYENPEKYFSEDLMKKIDNFCFKYFSYNI